MWSSRCQVSTQRLGRRQANTPRSSRLRGFNYPWSVATHGVDSGCGQVVNSGRVVSGFGFKDGS